MDDERGTARPGARDRAPVDMLGALDLLGRRIGGALVLGGALIGLGLYWGGDSGDEAPTYQAFAADGEVFRVDTEDGTIIACNAARCTRILESGQELAEEQGNTLFTRSVGPAQITVRDSQQARPAEPEPAAPQSDEVAPKQVDTGD